MFPLQQIRHRDSELFIALVAPIGADVSRVASAIAHSLLSYKYQTHSIRLIELLSQFEKWEDLSPPDEYDRITCRMDAGDQFREQLERADALALLALSEVKEFRLAHGEKKKKEEEPQEQSADQAQNANSEEVETVVPRQAYIFRSAKRPEEVVALRKIYGSNLLVIAIHSPRETRVQHLSDLISGSRAC